MSPRFTGGGGSSLLGMGSSVTVSEDTAARHRNRSGAGVSCPPNYSLESVQQLEEELLQNEFPSKVFQYLSAASHRLNGSSVARSGSDSAAEGMAQLLPRSHFNNEHAEPQTAKDPVEISNHASTHASSDEMQNITDTEYSRDSGGSSPDEDPHRPPSPIIIWRPSARVQIATDLPPELVAELLDGENVSGAGAAGKADGERHDFMQKGDLSSAGAAIAMKGHSSKMWRMKKKKKKRPRRYGAWYVKPSQWNDMMSGKLEVTSSQHEQKGFSVDSDIDRVIDGKVKEMKAVIPKLFIAKSYRAWLMKQNKTKPSDALPLPSYLARDEVRI